MNSLEELELKRAKWQEKLAADRKAFEDFYKKAIAEEEEILKMTRAYYEKQKRLNHVKPIECEIEIVNKTYGWRR
jgi:hypothetical protein